MRSLKSPVEAKRECVSFIWLLLLLLLYGPLFNSFSFCFARDRKCSKGVVIIIDTENRTVFNGEQTMLQDQKARQQFGEEKNVSGIVDERWKEKTNRTRETRATTHCCSVWWEKRARGLGVSCILLLMIVALKKKIEFFLPECKTETCVCSLPTSQASKLRRGKWREAPSVKTGACMRENKESYGGGIKTWSIKFVNLGSTQPFEKGKRRKKKRCRHTHRHTERKKKKAVNERRYFSLEKAVGKRSTGRQLRLSWLTHR